jgi:hypothetical protein
VRDAVRVVDIPKVSPLERGDALLTQAAVAYAFHAEATNDIEARHIIELCRAIINRNAAGATAAARAWMYQRLQQNGSV